jgi:hypothetical protein
MFYNHWRRHDRIPIFNLLKVINLLIEVKKCFVMIIVALFGYLFHSFLLSTNHFIDLRLVGLGVLLLHNIIEAVECFHWIEKS